MPGWRQFWEFFHWYLCRNRYKVCVEYENVMKSTQKKNFICKIEFSKQTVSCVLFVIPSSESSSIFYSLKSFMLTYVHFKINPINKWCETFLLYSTHLIMHYYNKGFIMQFWIRNKKRCLTLKHNTVTLVFYNIWAKYLFV